MSPAPYSCLWCPDARRRHSGLEPGGSLNSRCHLGPRAPPALGPAVVGSSPAQWEEAGLWPPRTALGGTHAGRRWACVSPSTRPAKGGRDRPGWAAPASAGRSLGLRLRRREMRGEAQSGAAAAEPRPAGSWAQGDLYSQNLRLDVRDPRAGLLGAWSGSSFWFVGRTSSARPCMGC